VLLTDLNFSYNSVASIERHI